MISPKNICFVIFLCLLSIVSVDAQKKSDEQIDELLLSARKTLVTYPDQTSLLAKKAYDLSIDSDYEKGQDYGLLLLNYGYFASRKYDQFITEYPKLEATALKHSNYEVLANAMLLKANTLSALKYYKLSTEEINKMIPIIKKISSKNAQNVYQGLVYSNIAGLFFIKYESRDSVIHYNLLAQKEFKKITDDKENVFLIHPKNDLLYKNYAILANEYIALKQLDSANYYLEKSSKIIPTYNNYSTEVLVNNNIAYSFLLRKNYPEAINYYNKSVDISKKYNNLDCLFTAYDGLAAVYQSMDDYKNTAKYMSLKNNLIESLVISREKMVSKSIDNILTQKEDNLKKKNDNLYRIIIISSILTLLCLCLIYILYKKFKKEKLTKKQIEVLLKEKMEQISHSPQENNDFTEEEDLEGIIKLAMNNDSTFYIKFQETFPNFINKLLKIAPSIVASELKFAAYLRLDFSTKEIARYTNTSVRAIEAKKYRLRKKLNIPSETDINVWLSKL